MSETKIGQIGLSESQIGRYVVIGFPIWVRADSRSENLDPIHNNISNHNSKTNTGRKLKQYGRKNLGHASGYVSRERSATQMLEEYFFCGSRWQLFTLR